MKGLLLKDVLNLRSQGKIIIFLVIFYLVMGVFMDGGEAFIGFIIVISMMMPVTSLSYDERAKWDGYALTMPLSRKLIVMEKYVLGLIFWVGSLIIGGIYMVILSRGTLWESLQTAIGISGAGLLYLAFMFPVLYKFGTEKGRILTIVALMGLFALAGASGALLHNAGNTAAQSVLNLIAVGLPLAGILLFTGSYFISIKIYSKKEF